MIKSQLIKLVFWGTPNFAIPALENLVKNGYKVLTTITQPDKPTGRNGKLSYPPVKEFAQKHGIKIGQPVSLKDEIFFEKFKNLNPDICIVAAYGKIIPSRYLEVSKYGFLNIHPSLLPKYRGPSPIQTAIMNGEKETGITIMKMDEQIDHGPAIATISYQLSAINYYKEVEHDLAELGAKLLVETLPKYISGEINPQEQDHSKATFTKMLRHEDGKINWDRPAEEIYNQIRALNPEPGTWTIWKNKILNIRTCDAATEIPEILMSAPGTVFIQNNDVAVQTKNSPITLGQIQPEGRKEMSAQDFTNGHPDFIGSRLS